MATHSDERPFKCDICEHRSRSRAHLMEHVVTHSNERPFKCNVCEHSTRRLGDLKIHMMTHSDDRPFKCDICSYSTRRRCNLKVHMMTHSDERPFKCDICEHRSRSRAHLMEHVATHSNERPFKCDMCEYRARRRRDLKAHMMTHSDERPFKCDTCEHRTRTQRDLKAHMMIHSDERPFECHFCNFAAKTKKTLIRHFSRLHPSKLGTNRKITKNISSKFKSKYDKSNFHLKCRFCGKLYKLGGYLIFHEKICRKVNSEVVTKDNSTVANQANTERSCSNSNEFRAPDTAIESATKLRQVGSEPVPNGSTTIEVDNSNDGHSESDPDEPGNSRAFNICRSEKIGLKSDQMTSSNAWPPICKFNTGNVRQKSEEMKKGESSENLSNDNFTSAFDLNCIKLEIDTDEFLPAIEAIQVSDSDVSKRELGEVEEPMNHVKVELDFGDNGSIDCDNNFNDKHLIGARKCSIILRKLEDLGNYHGCYYIRMKEPPYLYEVVKVNLNPVV